PDGALPRGRAAELLTVHGDTGALGERTGDPPFEFEIEIGREVVRSLVDGARRTVPGDEPFRDLVEYTARDGEQPVQVCGVGHRSARDGVERLGQCESARVERLSDDGAFDAFVGERRDGT